MNRTNTDEHGRTRTGRPEPEDGLTREILRVLREHRARGFITARELVGELGLVQEDPLRTVKKRIEDLKSLGYPIAALPGYPGPGYRLLDDPSIPGYAEARERTIADIKSRLGKMARHLAMFDAATARRVQLELGLEEQG